jgi:hypothetical protein
MVTREDDTCKPQSVMPMTKNSDADDRQKPGTQLHIRVMSLKTMTYNTISTVPTVLLWQNLLQERNARFRFSDYQRLSGL